MSGDLFSTSRELREVSFIIFFNVHLTYILIEYKKRNWLKWGGGGGAGNLGGVQYTLIL